MAISPPPQPSPVRLPSALRGIAPAASEAEQLRAIVRRVWICGHGEFSLPEAKQKTGLSYNVLRRCLDNGGGKTRRDLEVYWSDARPSGHHAPPPAPVVPTVTIQPKAEWARKKCGHCGYTPPAGFDLARECQCGKIHWVSQSVALVRE